MMDVYTIPCTESQTRKALKLGAPIESYISGDARVIYSKEKGYMKISSAEQMIGWLEEQGISVFCEPEPYKGNRIWIAKVYNINSPSNFHSYNCLYWKEFNTSKEATIAAINAALEYLINNKNQL